MFQPGYGAWVHDAKGNESLDAFVVMVVVTMRPTGGW